MQSFDPLQLQRLIDGELDRESTRTMLRMAEDNPLLWRDMASAFVENQMWQTDFEKLESSSVATAVQGLAPAVQKTQFSKANSPSFPWLALAAGMLVALTSGLFLGQQGYFATNGPDQVASTDHGQLPTSQLPTSQLPTHTVADLAPELTSAERIVTSRPDYHIQLEDANGNKFMESEIPLYSVSNNNRPSSGFDRPVELPQEFRKLISKRGYGVDQNVDYLSGRLKDGRQFYVPMRTINLSPGL